VRPLLETYFTVRNSRVIKHFLGIYFWPPCFRKHSSASTSLCWSILALQASLFVRYCTHPLRVTKYIYVPELIFTFIFGVSEERMLKMSKRKATCRLHRMTLNHRIHRESISSLEGDKTRSLASIINYYYMQVPSLCEDDIHIVLPSKSFNILNILPWFRVLHFSSFKDLCMFSKNMFT
jgi:hypothetical protein